MGAIETFDVGKFDALLGRGLCAGIGKLKGQMCIEAAVSIVLGEGLKDSPSCVTMAVRYFSVRLNDSGWSSPQARAAGLRALGLAQIGSSGVVDDVAFARRLAELHIRELVPAILLEAFPCDEKVEAAAKLCHEDGSAAADVARHAAAAARDAAARHADAAYAAADVARHAAAAARDAAARHADATAAAAAAARYADAAASYAAAATTEATEAASASAAASAAAAAAAAARYADAAAAARYAARYADDRYLRMSADIGVRVLRELGSPGVALLDKVEA